MIFGVVSVNKTFQRKTLSQYANGIDYKVTLDEYVLTEVTLKGDNGELKLTIHGDTDAYKAGSKLFTLTLEEVKD